MSHVPVHPAVSVVILNYNTPELTRACVGSVMEKTRATTFEIILVDNASAAVEPLRRLAAEDARIRLVESAENLGFAGGNNLGIEHASGDYILLLNSDTVLLNDAISIALEESRSAENIGAVSAKLLSPDGRVQFACRRFPSVWRELAEAFRLPKMLGRERRARWLQGGYSPHLDRMETDAIWGTFFFFPRRVLDLFPGRRLAETFFMYGEDMEWCWMIRQHGYRIVYQPAAEVEHFGGGSGFAASSGGSGATIYRHRIQFLRKYRGSAYALAYAVARHLNLLMSREPNRAVELADARTMFSAWREG